jgi:parallel beta-helix repeat protein
MDKKPLISKWVAIGIILLFVGTGIIPVVAQNTEKPHPSLRGTWLYVGGSGPGNYTSIQDAIDNASNGDIIFVFDESAPYYESLMINTSITLLGEEKMTTILNGSGQNKEVVTITTDHVTISSFTIINDGDEGILVSGNYTQITKIIFKPKISNGWSGYGIHLLNANHSLIEDNEISWMFDSIQLHSSHYNTVRRNHLSSSWLYGLWLSEATYNEIYDNIVDTGVIVGLPGSYIGIRLVSADNNTLMNNTIISQDDECVSGVILWESQNNTVTRNKFLFCGLDWYGSYQNTVNDNTVNTYPLIYRIGQPSSMITSAGQIILIQCPDSMIQNITITNTPKAITLIESKNCQVTNCSCVYNSYGIYTKFSPQNQITENILSNNEVGIAIDAGSSHTSITKNTVQESLYSGIASNAAFVRIEENHVVNNTWGIRMEGLFSIRNTINDNNVAHNWDGIVLSSMSTTITNNIIIENMNGIHIKGWANHNHIVSNGISQNECGINITHEPQTLWSSCNWIQKNNFIGNTRHASFDSSLDNHFIRNYWEGDRLPLHRIDGVLSFYKIDSWTGGIVWEKHIPWMDFDPIPVKKPYTVDGMN